MTETAHYSSAAEAETLRSTLERNRRSFAWKTSGLDEKGLRATTAASSMTLGGLVKHVALVEADWLAVAGLEYGAPWDAVDFDADPEWEWRTGAQDSPEDVYALWRAAVERSRSWSTMSSRSADSTVPRHSPGRTVGPPLSA